MTENLYFTSELSFLKLFDFFLALDRLQTLEFFEQILNFSQVASELKHILFFGYFLVLHIKTI